MRKTADAHTMSSDSFIILSVVSMNNFSDSLDKGIWISLTKQCLVF